MQTDPVVEAVERGGGFHRLLGVMVVSLGEGTASVELPAGERITNALGTQSGGALYGVADLAAAGAVASAFRAELPRTRSLVRDATVTFTRAARGLVRAHARVDAPLAELRTALDTDDRVVIPVAIDLVGPDEERLGHVDLRWNHKASALMTATTRSSRPPRSRRAQSHSFISATIARRLARSCAKRPRNRPSTPSAMRLKSPSPALPP